VDRVLFAVAGFLLGALVARIVVVRAARRVGLGPAADGAGAGLPVEHGDEVVLGGRTFSVVIEGSIDWDCHMMAALRKAGMMPLPRLLAGETPGEYAMRMLIEMLAGGHLPNLLGIVLVPAETSSTAWTPEVGAATEEYVRKLSAPEDRKKVHNLAVSILLDFFRDGTASEMISLTSSRLAEGDGPAEKVEAASVAMGNGAASFATLQTEILNARR
jgi:hypothetical protein